MDRIRIVPFKVNFELIKKIDRGLTYILYLSAVLGVILLILLKFLTRETDHYSEKINYLVGSLSLFYFIGDLIKKFLLQLAEQRRRKDFIDNSLNTNLADFKSEGYYSNDEFDVGIYKMGVNCFENSFFSMSISAKMIWSSVITSTIILSLFITLVMTTDKITVATFLQFALPYSLLQQTIILIIYYFQINSIFNYFKLLFSSAQESKRDLLLIHNVINYESTISWAGVILNDRLFHKNNNDLSAKWEIIKLEHNIVSTENL
jgi:hypothetical protein